MANEANASHPTPAPKQIRSVLISQPAPLTDKSPYHDLAQRYNVKVDFRQFIEVQPVSLREFRKQRINILDHTAVIFTSRNAVDHFFTLCKGLKITIPEDMKYFCVSEQTAIYLPKYINLRKRKLFVGERTAEDLNKVIAKHKKEKFLFPCSDIRRDDIPGFLRENNIEHSEAVIYATVSSDLSDLKDVNYDVIAFFSPSGIKSLFDNFPDFKQKTTRIAAFGPTTAQAVRDHNLRLDIEAPLPNAPSMTGAIEQYIRKMKEELGIE